MKTLWGVGPLLALALWCAPRAAFGFLCVEPLTPGLVFDPPSFDVGSAPIGGSKNLPVSVRYESRRTVLNGQCVCNCANAASAALTLSFPPGSAFSTAPNAFTLADGEARNIDLKFQPAGAQGIYSDNLTVASPAFAAPVVTGAVGVGFTGQSNIDVNLTDVDFGPVETGTTRVRYVNIVNVGTAPLVGSVATDAPFAVTPSTFNLQPGSTFNATVTFHPTVTGEASGELRIHSNDQDASFLSIALGGRGIQAYASMSATSLDFGTIPTGETLTKTLKVTNSACASCGDNFVLNLSAFITSSGFTATPPADLSLEPGESAVIPVSFSSATATTKGGTLRFSTNDPLNTQVEVDLSGKTVVSSLDPSAMTIAFGDSHLGAVKSVQFSLRNKGAGSLSITGFTPPSSRVTVTPASATIAAGATQNFQARYAPTATSATTLPNETLTGQLTVNSNDAGLPAMKLDLSGRGVSPVMSVTPVDTVFAGDAIDLGTLYAGDVRTFRLRVSNTGNESLSVSSILTSLGAFAPLSPSISVPPMTSSEIEVRYQPPSEGSHAGTLTFSGNDFFRPSYPVSLKGACVSSLDLAVSRIEATQSIQNEANDLPLVAGKATVVRTFVSSTIRGAPNTGDVIRKVDGLLRLTKNGVSVPGSPFLSVNGPIGVVPTPNRADAAQTLNFLVPPATLATNESDEWAATVEINPASGARAPRLKESSYDNNARTRNLTFFDTYEPLVHYVPMSINGDPLPPDARMIEGKRLMEKVFPIASVRYVRRPPIALNVDVTYANVGKILQAVFFASHLGNVAPPDRTYGWFPLDYSSPDNFRGYAEGIPGRVAVGGELSSVPSAQETFAHEMGHTYGLCHTNTPVSDSCPTGYSDAHEPADQDVADVGFDVDAQQTVVGSKDLMTIKTLSKRWIHPKRYRHLFDRLRDQASDPSDARGLCFHRPSACDSLFQPVRLVSGTLADDGRAELHPVFTASSLPEEPEEDFTTPYAVRFLDAGGNTLEEYPLHAASETGLDGDPLEEHAFSLVVPDFEGLDAVQILRGATVLAERRASERSPELSLDAPTLTETLNVRWAAEDPDGDPLLFSVLYSADGGAHFRAVGVDLTGTDFSYDAAKLAGGDAVVRVAASDGFHTVFRDSEPIAVPTKAPEVHLLAPSDGQTILSGNVLIAEAEANDVEDGLLNGESLRWSSDISGFLGTGRTLATVLPAGRHSLTVTAKDASGKEASATTTLLIVNGASPRAHAGALQRVPEDAWATLDASASADPDDDSLTYEWTQVAGPVVILDDNLSTRPSFLAPMVSEDTQLRFRVTVRDTDGNVGTDFADIIVENVFYPSLQLIDSLLNFGISGVGQPVSRTMTVSNQGNESLVITDVVAPRADFSGAPKAFTLEPGQSRTVEVSFRPTEEAEFDSYVRFASNSIAGVPTRVFVKGTTPNPKVHYNDNGVGASLLPAAASGAADPAFTPEASSSLGAGGGCGLIP